LVTVVEGQPRQQDAAPDSAETSHVWESTAPLVRRDHSGTAKTALAGDQPSFTSELRTELPADVLATPMPLYRVQPASQLEREALVASSTAMLYLPDTNELFLLVEDGFESALAWVRRAQARGPANSTDAAGLTLAQPAGVATVADLLDELDQRLEASGPDGAPHYVLMVPAVEHSAPTAEPVTQGVDPVSAQAVTGTVLLEDFEGTQWSQWTITDNNNGGYRWGPSTCEAHTGFNSADAIRGGKYGPALACDDDYPDNIETALTTSSCINLQGASEAWLDLYVHVDTERTNDYLAVTFQAPDQAWLGWLISSNWGAWQHLVFDLKRFNGCGDLTTRTCNKLRLGFVSDPTVQGGMGVRVDDVRITTGPITGLACQALVTPLQGPAPLSATLTGGVQGTKYPYYYWQVEGNTISENRNTTYTFTQPGDYRVTFGVDDDYAFCLSTAQVTVTEPPCTLTCTATVPTSALVGAPVQFQSSAAPSHCSVTVTYDWDFGDGTPHSAQQSPQHVYDALGTYAWTLTVRSGDITCTRTGTIGIVAAPPISDAGFYTYVIPAAAHVSGLKGTTWVTDAVIHNPSATLAADVSLYFLERDKANAGAVGTTIQVSPGTSATLPDIVKETFGSDNLSGAVYLGSNVPVLVSSRTYNNAPDGTYGQYIAGIRTTNAIGTGPRARVIQLSKTAEFRTNFGLVNVSPTSISVLVDLYRSNGYYIGSKSYSLPPFGYMQETNIIDTFVPADVPDAYAVVQLTSAGNFVAYASIVDNRTGDPVCAAPSYVDGGLVSGGTETYVPAAAALAGAAGTNWRTDLELHNPSSETKIYRIDLLRRDATNAAPTSGNVTLEAGNSKRLDNVLARSFNVPSGAATLRISTQGMRAVATARTYNDQPEGTFGQFIAGVPSFAAIEYPSSAFLLQLTQSPAFRTNIGFVNLNSSMLLIEVALHRRDGSVVSTRSYSLGAYEYRQVDQIFAGVTLELIENGFAVVRALTADGKFLAYASVIDNQSGDPIYIPARLVD